MSSPRSASSLLSEEMTRESASGYSRTPLSLGIIKRGEVFLLEKSNDQFGTCIFICYALITILILSLSQELSLLKYLNWLYCTQMLSSLNWGFTTATCFCVGRLMIFTIRSKMDRIIWNLKEHWKVSHPKSHPFKKQAMSSGLKA